MESEEEHLKRLRKRLARHIQKLEQVKYTTALREVEKMPEEELRVKVAAI